VRSVRESFSSEEAFREALASKGVTEDALEQLLRQQIAIARYIERRFRSLVHVTEGEITEYYNDELVAELRKSGEQVQVPAPDAVAERIRRILVERKFNERVDEWIQRLKARSLIRRYVW
jgi:predicted DNA-binding transcriptional regulator YafY